MTTAQLTLVQTKTVSSRQHASPMVPQHTEKTEMVALTRTSGRMSTKGTRVKKRVKERAMLLLWSVTMWTDKHCNMQIVIRSINRFLLNRPT
jgi:hypothetical protein